MKTSWLRWVNPPPEDSQTDAGVPLEDSSSDAMSVDAWAAYLLALCRPVPANLSVMMWLCQSDLHQKAPARHAISKCHGELREFRELGLSIFS